MFFPSGPPRQPLRRKTFHQRPGFSEGDESRGGVKSSSFRETVSSAIVRTTCRIMLLVCPSAHTADVLA